MSRTLLDNMIKATRKFANEICKEVGVDIEIYDSDLAEWANRVQNTNNEPFIEAKTSRHCSRNDHQTRVDRWKENLSREEIKSVVPIVRETAF